MNMSIPFHPLAEAFPLIEGVQFNELVAAIKENGLREAITLFEGAILDGRNRYLACEAAGVAPRTEQFNGGDPIRFVVDKNINRRHLNESQRGLIAARLMNLKAGDNQHPTEVAHQRATTSRKQAAELLDVSERTVTDSQTVLTRGAPEDIESIESGKTKVKTVANKIRSKSKGNQAMPANAKAAQTKAAKEKQMHSKAKAAKEKQIEGHKQRVKTMNMQADIWRRLREALDYLTSLPLPEEVAVIARFNDKKTKGAAVERKLAPAIEWLTEFSNAWNRNG